MTAKKKILMRLKYYELRKKEKKCEGVFMIKEKSKSVSP